MQLTLAEEHREHLEHALERSGLRSTRQREQIFAVLLSQRDHPTADEVFVRAREVLPTISLATVYNCLETLTQCGLVRQVNIERDAARYCPNLAEHAHFHDKATGRVHDIELPAEVLARLQDILPPGYRAEAIDIRFHGLLPEDAPSRS